MVIWVFFREKNVQDATKITLHFEIWAFNLTLIDNVDWLYLSRKCFQAEQLLRRTCERKSQSQLSVTSKCRTWGSKI